MQEITIKPRSVFHHYVTVEEAGKELMWNFATKKKSIAFGLYKLEEGVTSLPADLATSRSSLLNIMPKAVNSRSSSASSVRSIREDILRGQTPEPPNCESVMPIAHYDSGKVTIKGSYLVQEPKTFCLVFDNTFSVKTSKKLYFYVSLRDVERKEILDKKDIEGWLLKKGNRSMQGFTRRWVEIHSSGVLTYFKGPGRGSHGSVNLFSCAIRLNHDYYNMDIDSETATYHFKTESKAEFERWTAVFEKFSNSEIKSPLPFNPLSNSPALTEKPSEIDFYRKSEPTLTDSLHKELVRIRDIIQNAKADIDSKTPWTEFVNTLATLSAMIHVSAQNAKALHEQFERATLSFKSSQNSTDHDLSVVESTLKACLEDNNNLRKKFGLEPVNRNNFVQNSAAAWISQPSLVLTEEDRFFDAEGGDSEFESSSEESVSSNIELEPQSVGLGISKDMDSLSINSALSDHETLESTPNTTQKTFQRRTNLPAPAASMENISIMGILQKNLGKDLSTVAMPIALNEPINLLQKLCEELEYCELLDIAATIDDPVFRMAQVAAFVVSGYSSTMHRAARKPFNPLLGETYECNRPDKGFKYIAEKVSHHPAIMACHAFSDKYEFYQDSLLKSKFWGKTMELTNVGTINLKFPKLNEHYSWNKVTTSMRNLLSSSRYLEHHGTLRITSHSTGHYCELTFKESGYFSSGNNEVVGGVFNKSKKKLLSLSGRWDNSLNHFYDNDPNSLQVLWRVGTFPQNLADNYGFTQFAIELNEITPDIAADLPKSDTRYRTDQRLYEEGRLDDAEQEKLRLEQKQREKRKALETAGKSWQPRFFEQQDGIWRYKGNYWPKRGEFSDDPDLFS